MNDYMYHSGNDNRKFTNETFYKSVVKSVEKKIKRNLSRSEINESISFIKKLDPSLLSPEYQGKTIPIMITTLSNEFQKFNCKIPEYDDSQQILRETIGLTSESGTTHGVYDNPKFHLRNKKKDNVYKPPTNSQVNELTNSQVNELTNSQVNELTNSQVNELTNTPNDINNFLGISNTEDITRVLNPNALYRKNFMLLDSRYRILSGSTIDGISTFSWNYILKSQIEAQGSVNIIGNVRDIIAMRVYPFRIPYVASADNKYSRISMFVEELGSQAFVAHENRKFHFMLRASIDSEFIDVETSEFNDGFFYFEKPITTLNTLTLSFGSPLEKIIFPNDRSWCSIDYFSLSPLTLITTYVNSPLGSSLQKHGLNNGDRVYFELFNVGDVPSTLVDQKLINDTIKETINQVDGFLVNVIDDTSFSISYDTSEIQNPLPNIRFRVFFGSKRMFIPIELTYIMPSIVD
jgi:hypothetical protein